MYQSYKISQLTRKRHDIHYNDVIMGTIASQITSLTIINSTVCSDADKENIKAPRHWLCAGNSLVTGEFPTQMASNEENVAIWWRHHVITRSQQCLSFLVGLLNYSDVTWASCRHTNVLITGLLWRETTGERWIPITKDQCYGKHFHFMTSSWNCE